jgi:hypothetical protein
MNYNPQAQRLVVGIFYAAIHSQVLLREIIVVLVGVTIFFVTTVVIFGVTTVIVVIVVIATVGIVLGTTPSPSPAPFE